MCIKTTVSWSWPVSLRRRWTAGRLLSYELECTLNAAWYNSLLHYYRFLQFHIISQCYSLFLLHVNMLCFIPPPAGQREGESLPVYHFLILSVSQQRLGSLIKLT